jgi:hypothetical protein
MAGGAKDGILFRLERWEAREGFMRLIPPQTMLDVVLADYLPSAMGCGTSAVIDAVYRPLDRPISTAALSET